MQKHLYMIGGPMGVGKTTVAQILKKQLTQAVYLDGDWCWDADPFVVTDKTKMMVMDNICFLLDQFLNCSSYANVIFTWVLHDQAMIDSIKARLQECDVIVHEISLTCSENILIKRLEADISKGMRDYDVIARSLDRLKLYPALKTTKIDTDGHTPVQIAELIIATQKE